MTDVASGAVPSGQRGERVGAEWRKIARRLGRVRIFENPSDAAVAWSELEAVAPASVYQTQRWLMPWIETIGRRIDVSPMIVVAYGANDAPVALFPFGVAERRGMRVVTFLGGCDSNSNLGLIHPQTRLDKSDIMSLLRAISKHAPQQPDAFVLTNQPMTWEGVQNPFASLRHQCSPSEGHSATLLPGVENFIKRQLSADARKKLRKKWKKLSEIGPITHIVASNPDEVAHILDTFFLQKLERFRQKSISSEFEEPATRDFFLRACLDGISTGNPAIELHALKAGDRVVAVYAGTPHRGRFHAMINSFDLDDEIARTSPGDLLLMSMMQMMCDRNYTSFDLGIGEARYKSSWCDQSEPMFDTLVGVTLKGRVYALASSSWLRFKRNIKQNRWAWATVRKLRGQFG